MRPLIKVMLLLGAVFALTFILARIFGILTVENVRHWLELAQSVDPVWVFGTVVFLLFLDVFFAVPTLTISILSGFFLGFPIGATAAFLGMTAASFSGYLISRIWGDRAISKLIKNKSERLEMADTFQKNGPTMIVLSRAVPMFPEITACMAGATSMPFSRYWIFFTISSLPYALIASYAGSISSPASPQPAIIAAIVLYGVLWSGWYIFRRGTKKA